MHRIAVISDIHGNRTALEAVLDDISRRDIADIICLGDLIGKGPHSPECVDLVRSVCKLVVRGNWDDFISKPTEDEALKWHQRRLGEERLQYLKMLPLSIELRLSGRLVRLYHASAKSVYYRVQPWDPIEERIAMFENTELTGGVGSASPDVIGYGDVHNAFVQHLSGKVLFNPGSVGNPLDMAQAAYAILEGEPDCEGPMPFSIQLVRVPYDIEKSIQEAQQMDMPQLEPYAKELRTGRYRGLKS